MSETQIEYTAAGASYENLPAQANLGCGEDYRTGWHNVDVREDVDSDEIIDLDADWPWPANSFKLVMLDNVIEHLDDRLHALRQCHRVTESGGRVILRFPHWNSAGHYSTPSHTKTLTHRTFENYEVRELFEVLAVDCQRVRFGRALPKPAALWVADHVGHIVSEVEVELEVQA